MGGGAVFGAQTNGQGRRNSLPTHLSESERERAVGMWMEGGTHEKGLEVERVRVSVKATQLTFSYHMHLIFS